MNQERIVNTFMDYVRISSPTNQEGKFAAHMCEELKGLGFEVTVDDAGPKVGSDTGNVIAKLKGNTDGETILFSCHLDTVSPGMDIKPVIKDGTIYSDGTTVLGADDKAGIAAIIEAIRVLKEENIPHADIEISLSVYEEGGLYGAKNLDYSQFASKKAFILDSGGDPGQIIIQGPAQDKLDIKVIGRPAHAGVCPEEGISAIMVASEAISNMKLLRIDEETTANIGTVLGGGPTNVVVAEVMIKAEARSLNNDKLKAQSDHMVACFEAAAEKFGAKIESNVVKMYAAFSIDPEADIVLKAKQACENIGIKPFTDSSGGGSDTNIFNANGLTAINLGIGERKPHTLEEHIHIKDLVASSRIVLELIKVHA